MTSLLRRRGGQRIAAIALAGTCLLPLPSSAQSVRTLAGSGSAGKADGAGRAASFDGPEGVAVDGYGDVYVADRRNNAIRKITAGGLVTTLAGSTGEGAADGKGAAASFFGPSGIAVDKAGTVYVADQRNNRIRKVVAGEVTSLAGSGAEGRADGAGTAASFWFPSAVAVDGAGNVYVADQLNNAIRKVTPDGVVVTFAGSGIEGSADGAGKEASFRGPSGVAVDGVGNVYVADQLNNRIRKITAAGFVSTLAGSGKAGSADGAGRAASFDGPSGLAVDAAGRVYVADQGNRRVRRISPAGRVTTLAGSGSDGSADGAGNVASFRRPRGLALDGAGMLYVADAGGNEIRTVAPGGLVTTLAGSGAAGSADGAGSWASFKSPGGVAVDGAGNVYVADSSNNRIRKITSGGLVTTVAGSGKWGGADDVGRAASFAYPKAIAVDGGGNLYVADWYGYTVRKITPDGAVTTLAGSGIWGDRDGVGKAASFNHPRGVAVDRSGTVYVADTSNNKIRKIEAGGVVTTLAGSGKLGSLDGTGAAASFWYPFGVAVDAAGNVYVAESTKIRKVSPSGVVTTLAGSGGLGSADGKGVAASFNNPGGLALDANGNVYVADTYGSRIRKVTPDGEVTTLAGSGELGDADGEGVAASFQYPYGVAADRVGRVYVADSGNHKIRIIDAPPATRK